MASNDIKLTQGDLKNLTGGGPISGTLASNTLVSNPSRVAEPVNSLINSSPAVNDSPNINNNLNPASPIQQAPATSSTIQEPAQQALLIPSASGNSEVPTSTAIGAPAAAPNVVPTTTPNVVAAPVSNDDTQTDAGKTVQEIAAKTSSISDSTAPDSTPLITDDNEDQDQDEDNSDQSKLLDSGQGDEYENADADKDRESNEDEDQTIEVESLFLPGNDVYRGETPLNSSMLQFSSADISDFESDAKISDVLGKDEINWQTMRFLINNQGSSSVVVNGDMNYEGKSLEFTIQPGHYKAGQQYNVLNVGGKFIHDISDSPEFKLYDMNQHELKYNFGMEPESIAKVAYGDHGASFEFLRNITVTMAGYVDPNSIDL